MTSVGVLTVRLLIFTADGRGLAGAAGTAVLGAGPVPVGDVGVSPAHPTADREPDTRPRMMAPLRRSAAAPLPFPSAKRFVTPVRLGDVPPPAPATPDSASVASARATGPARGAGAALAEMLFDTVAVGVALVDRELRYVRVNAALAAMNGLPAEAHAGRPVRDVLPPAAATALEPLLQRVLATGEPVVDLAFAAHVPERGRRDFLASYHPVRDAAGAVTGVAALVAERTPAEVALRETEGRLRRVAESGIVGLFFWRMDGGITEANDAFLAMLGYTRADLAAGRVDWRRMTPPEYAASDEAAVGELLTTGRHGQVAKEYIGKDGRRVPVVVTSALLEGSADRGVCVCLDDTARRVAEARLGRVLGQTPAAVAVLLGPDHVVHSVNEMFLRLLGRRDYVGRPAREGAPELVEQGFLARMDEVYRSGVPFHGREAPLLWDRDGDGTLREGFFDFVYQPLLDAAGAVEGILVFAVEVTAQVQARQQTERASERAEAARTRAERLQALTAALARAATPAEVARVTLAEGLTALGSAISYFYGPAGDGRALETLATHGVLPEVIEAYRTVPLDVVIPATDAVRTGAPLWIETDAEFRARYPHLAGSRGEAEGGAAVALPVPVGGATGALVMAFPVERTFGPEDRANLEAVATLAGQALERARLFAAERAARAEAEAADRAKSEFLAVMSHELRTPLNAIGGYAELLEMGIHGPVSAPQLDALRRIQRSQRHLLGLINEVLNYARLETGAVRYDVTDVCVGEALAEAEGLVAPQARAKGLTLTAADRAADVAARADVEKLRQILVNLLSNAIKFTDRGGRIDVGCAMLGDRVRIHVRDTGIGIPADQLEGIFEPFVQVRADLTRPHEGTGLGLAISRDLARGMGGDITVESTLGEGSTFTLTLPRA